MSKQVWNEIMQGEKLLSQPCNRHPELKSQKTTTMWLSECYVIQLKKIESRRPFNLEKAMQMDLFFISKPFLRQGAMPRAGGRVDKALDWKSNGVSPRRFDPWSHRFFFLFLSFFFFFFTFQAKIWQITMVHEFVVVVIYVYFSCLSSV